MIVSTKDVPQQKTAAAAAPAPKLKKMKMHRKKKENTTHCTANVAWRGNLSPPREKSHHLCHMYNPHQVPGK